MVKRDIECTSMVLQILQTYDIILIYTYGSCNKVIPYQFNAPSNEVIQ